ncbi:hypothetical protein TRSC58_00939 [Trypanosoma rangeli SC58]|uniref:Uncharacterized protein n=1 Tax=Trypanosoma rangeli SC58 TaxID=429131 RepID=A0A061J797_TRYRA|nr:hypothetical protein TRSC58_00939 [Trypanosoma rangeli SC58]
MAVARVFLSFFFVSTRRLHTHTQANKQTKNSNNNNTASIIARLRDEMLRRGFASMKQASATTLFMSCGTLYFRQKGVYEPIGGSESAGQYTISIEIDEEETPSCRYAIVVYEEDEEVLRQYIGNGLTLAYSSVSVHWPASIDGAMQYIAFLFADDGPKVKATQQLEKFVLLYNRCTYALLTETSVDSTISDDEEYEFLSVIATSRLPEDTYEEPIYELDVSHECANPTGRGKCVLHGIKAV